MVEKLQTENPLNKQMHYGKPLNVGILNPPDKLPKVVVYSESEANRRYNNIQHDLYIDQKNAPAYKKKKGFPAILKILGGLAAAASLIIFRKDIIKYFKKLF